MAQQLVETKTEALTRLIDRVSASAEELANRILELSPTIKKTPAAPETVGFSWSEHVAKLLAIASQLSNGTAENEDVPANHLQSLTQAS